MDAGDFYTGLVMEPYEPLRGSVPEPGAYIDLVRRFGEPALELGCGGGDPLVALRLAGLDVEGIDSSVDILDVCRAKARAVGVDVVLHAQRMEDLDLGRTYPLIYLAGPTSLAEEAGLSVEAVLDDDGRPADPSATDVTFVLRRATVASPTR